MVFDGLAESDVVFRSCGCVHYSVIGLSDHSFYFHKALRNIRRKIHCGLKGQRTTVPPDEVLAEGLLRRAHFVQPPCVPVRGDIRLTEVFQELVSPEVVLAVLERGETLDVRRKVVRGTVVRRDLVHNHARGIREVYHIYHAAEKLHLGRVVYPACNQHGLGVLGLEVLHQVECLSDVSQHDRGAMPAGPCHTHNSLPRGNAHKPCQTVKVRLRHAHSLEGLREIYTTLHGLLFVIVR